jgi:hypothetical protein
MESPHGRWNAPGEEVVPHVAVVLWVDEAAGAYFEETPPHAPIDTLYEEARANFNRLARTSFARVIVFLVGQDDGAYWPIIPPGLSAPDERYLMIWQIPREFNESSLPPAVLSGLGRFFDTIGAPMGVGNIDQLIAVYDISGSINIYDYRGAYNWLPLELEPTESEWRFDITEMWLHWALDAAQRFQNP